MKIEAASRSHVAHVAHRLRAGDLREFLPLSYAETESELAEILTQMWSDHPAGFAFLSDDGEPIGIGAMVEGRPNVVTLLFFATDRFNEIALPLARYSKRDLFARYISNGVHRIECVSIDGYEEAHRWIRLVGMQHEATMPGYGKGGETYHQFAWVADDRPIG
jgi:hypothetical protein